MRAEAAGLEQATAGCVAAGQAGDTAPCGGHRLLVRQPLDHRLDPGGVRPLAAHGEAVGHGRWAGYGYYAGHSRFFRGLRLYLVCAPTGMPILWALASPKPGEREVLTAMPDREPDAVTGRPGLPFVADKGFVSKEFEADLALRGAALLRPSFKREKRRGASRC
ncbi:hypothetical protein ACFSL4_13190 [Streptomyces caeni]|uniref:Transposase n=1 Tax=Streptomyces caeni TaxID=2307231 RepID=A0ABW4IRH6_9ACTN